MAVSKKTESEKQSCWRRDTVGRRQFRSSPTTGTGKRGKVSLFIKTETRSQIIFCKTTIDGREHLQCQVNRKLPWNLQNRRPRAVEISTRICKELGKLTWAVDNCACLRFTRSLLSNPGDLVPGTRLFGLFASHLLYRPETRKTVVCPQNCRQMFFFYIYRND